MINFKFFDLFCRVLILVFNEVRFYIDSEIYDFIDVEIK